MTQPFDGENFKKLNWKYIIFPLVLGLILIPICFNYSFIFLFIWDNGMSKYEPSDWFTFYGDIFLGLIGGFFSYWALALTFKREAEVKIGSDYRPVD